MKYVHIKSDRVYDVKFFNVINATNAQDGQEMVCYKGMKKDGSGEALFVRETKEFYEKFKKLTEKEKVLYTVLNIINESFGEEGKPDYTFKDDLGLDSLDLIELVMEIEEEYGISIKDDVAEQMFRQTVSEFVDNIYTEYF